MGRYHVLTLLPCLAASFARAQTSDATAPDTSVSAPIYTPEQCNSWVGVLVASDGDASNGLSNDEYYSFLSNITEPRYIAEYFGGYAGFDQLPWVFRVVQKSLACHCEKLGFGGKCCEGDDAEVLLSGLGNSTALSPSAGEKYKDLFCQQIAFVLTKTISSPAPTAAPSAVPSARPTEAPTFNPSTSPSSATPTTAPVKRPTTSPVAASANCGTCGGTVEPVVAPTSLRPTATPTQQEVIPKVGRQIGGDDRKSEGGLGTGAIIVIIIAALLAALFAIIALVAYHRRKEEEARVREFAGGQAPEADLEVPVASRELVLAPELAIARAPAEEKEEDDDSSAPSVWSDGEAGDTVGELHDQHADPGVTAGSALAAMGAASTVTARISTASDGDGDRGGDPGDAGSDTAVCAGGPEGARADRRISFAPATKTGDGRRGTVFYDAKSGRSVYQNAEDGDGGDRVAEGGGSGGVPDSGGSRDGAAGEPDGPQGERRIPFTAASIGNDGGAGDGTALRDAESGRSLYYDAESERTLYHDAESGRSLYYDAESGRTVYHDAEGGDGEGGAAEAHEPGSENVEEAAADAAVVE